jgi:hypothetical protein
MVERLDETGAVRRKRHVFVCPFCPNIIVETQRKGPGVKIWVMVEQVYQPRGDGKKVKRMRLLGSMEV